MDAENEIIFVSSHDRLHIATVTGEIFAFSAKTDELIPLNVTYPPNFRPHGIAIANGCEALEQNSNNYCRINYNNIQEECVQKVTRLFVISHLDIENGLNAIEVFDFYFSDNGGKHPDGTLQHVRTLKHSTLHSPNDLFALGCEEILVSNDRPKGNKWQILMDLLSRKRNADMVYFNLRRVSSWSVVNQVDVTTEEVSKAPTQRRVEHNAKPRTTKTTYSPKRVYASYGNGLITLPLNESFSLLLRSSTADYTLQIYEISHQNKARVTLRDEILLPISPDNIELSHMENEVLITGHPYLPFFILYALSLKLPLPQWLRFPAPSAVIKFNAHNHNISLLYYNDGQEISASSVALLGPERDDSVRKLYIGQVFEPFVLSCYMKNQ